MCSTVHFTAAVHRTICVEGGAPVIGSVAGPQLLNCVIVIVIVIVIVSKYYRR